jgi:hypothetical protein
MPGKEDPYGFRTYLDAMYTGKTERPCCLCADPDTVARVDLPPRAVQLLKHSGPIAWRDIEGDVSIYFCESDWEVVEYLVLEQGTSPLGKCNVARASFVLREDFEALLAATRDEPDQRPLEREMYDDATRVIEGYGESDSLSSARDLVEARIVRWALDDLGYTAEAEAEP